ncbi:biosynthetic-type acetolactate synthase large subunit [Rhodohalobacter sp.]|uniref:biosynthetic-type acetolactate synthase large subunit n=1 Tax=Rhodohalobacter sp. TaxID=1974210 RepID=UPI002ACED016|nr:biosynthetic-type acetolactate synthase large subunit [Rhodohalobacter sp.]MDZ7758604.1 biosynthetic-type acetolactate synthase large subunit [Rhodohalobacter sp.]
MKSNYSTSSANTKAQQPSLKTVEKPESLPHNGAEILIKTLTDLGVDTLFGYPGGAVLPIYDTLFDNHDLNHVLIRHEQAGTHAADGYARATGKPGVVLATSGPGGTNTVTGIATAMMDSIPLVVFTGQVPTGVIGNDAFQEADIVGITRPITKQNYLVRDVNELEHVIREAFHIATNGRPGPVLVDLPKDMLNTKSRYSGLKKVEIPSFKPHTNGHHPQIAKAAEMLSNAKKPLLYVGGGAISGEAWEEVTAMAERLNVPVTTTLMGLGAFPENKSQSLGMLGMHGTWYANMAMTECDVLVAVGARFDDRVTGRLSGFSQKSRKIHIDIDPSCIGKNVAVEVPIVGDVKNVIPAIDKLATPPEVDEWWDTINKWKEEHPLKVPQAEDKIYPQHMVKMISEITNGDAIVVTDVGQHQMWAAQHYKYNHPRSWISSGGLGTMGYGFPAAIGAALAKPDREVVCITGDGGFQMCSFELATAVEYKIPVKIAIMNNNCLGMVRQWQQLFFENRTSCSVFGKNNPDFVKMAEAYGAVGMRATNPAEMQDVLKKAMAIKDGPVLMDFSVIETENCYPMVPSGAALNEMVESDEECKKL